MTTTNLSHFGIELLKVTKNSAVLGGSLAACKRIAFAHGLEIDREWKACESYRVVGWYFKQGGFILQGRDDWQVLIPREIWDERL